MADISALDRQIQEGEARLRQLRDDREAAIAANADLYELAVYLHDVECRANHTDQCGWGYEYIRDTNPVEPDWNGWTHKRYLARAHKVFVEVGMTHAEIVNALAVVNRLKDIR